MAPAAVAAKPNKKQEASSIDEKRREISCFCDERSLCIYITCFLILGVVGVYVNLNEIGNVNVSNGVKRVKNSVQQAAPKVSVPTELVLCVAPCNAAFQDRALVRRGRPGSTDQSDVKAASYPLAEALSLPKEIRKWQVVPFTGPYFVIVSTRPENYAKRAAIRSGWGNPKRYPIGAFRLVFFLRGFRNVGPRITNQMKLLLKEAERYQDMAVEGFNLSSVRSMMLEYAPGIASASKLLLWARDSFVVEPGHFIQWVNRLGKVAGDVFGRAIRYEARVTKVQENTAGVVSDVSQLEQCAYFLKMSALVRMANNYEDQPPKRNKDDEYDLVAPSLARQSNLTFVAGNFLPPCPGAPSSISLPRVIQGSKPRKMG